jgi:SCY1-like protein 1
MVAHFEASTKRKAFSAAIARALQDPFPPAKAAGLQTLLASLDAFEAEQLARMILPTVCALLVDPDGNTRRQAFAAVRSILERIEACNSVADKERGELGEKTIESPSQQQQQNWWGLERLTSQVSSVQEKYLGKAKTPSSQQKQAEIQASKASSPLQPANKAPPQPPMAKASPLHPTARTPPQLPSQTHAPPKVSKPMKLSRPVQEGWEENELNIPSANDSPKPKVTPSPRPFEEDNIIAGLNLDNDWASEKDPWA